MRPFRSFRRFASVPMVMLCLAGPGPVKAQTPQLGTVVMIHGAGGGAWEYRFWRPPFERAGWKVIIPELKPSAHGLASTHFEDYVREVRQAIPPNHGRLVLVGASLGGILALSLAATEHPYALVLVDSVPPAGVGAAPSAKQYPAIMRWANGPLKDTQDAMPDSDRATILWAYKRWRDESGAVMNEITRGIEVEKPHLPALVVLGSHDTDVPLANGLALADWAGADIHEYAGTSHVGPLLGRRATEIASSVIQWLNYRTASSPSVNPLTHRAATRQQHR